MKSALTFRAGSIGDSLMGKYFLENVRAAYPNVRCTLAVASRGAMVRNLFAAYPWLEVVEANRKTSSLWALVRGGRRDLVVTSYTGGVFPFSAKLLARALGRLLVGYRDRSRFNFLYDRLITIPGRDRPPRLLECDALETAGIPVLLERPTYVYLPQPELLLHLQLQAGRYVVVHLFSGSDARGLSPARKRALIDTLRRKCSIPIAITGTPKETASLGPLPEGITTVHTSLQELAHLIDHSAAVVSLDTGAAHIAAHLRKPLVVLASCVGMQWWDPRMYGEDARTLFTRADVCGGVHDYSGYAKCLEAIDMDEVARAASELS